MGRIKDGEGALIGSAGENYVVAELLKRGVIASITSKHAPSFDILATKCDRTIRIRVKTKSKEFPEWQWNAKTEGSIFRDLHDQDDFVVLVDMGMDTSDVDYYVLPTMLVNEWLQNDWEEWLGTPGKRNQPHSATNKKRHLRLWDDKDKSYTEELMRCSNDWNRLWSSP